MNRFSNEMRWNCNLGGPGQNCFNRKRRPKIEVFAECFPRPRQNFGDVDGIAEIGGRFCLLEWKGAGGVLQEGQRRTYDAFSRVPGNLVLVVNGDAETMDVSDFYMFWKGRERPPFTADLGDVKDCVRRWVSWADTPRLVA